MVLRDWFWKTCWLASKCTFHRDGRFPKNFKSQETERQKWISKKAGSRSCPLADSIILSMMWPSFLSDHETKGTWKTRHQELCCLDWSQSVQIAPTKCHGVGQFQTLTHVQGSRRVGVYWGPISSLHGKRDLIYEGFFPPQHNHLPNTSLLISSPLWLVSLCVDLGIDTKLSDQRASAHSSFTCFPISSCWSLQGSLLHLFSCFQLAFVQY